jgi:EPS-associated MarR family transcriptional regulator
MLTDEYRYKLLKLVEAKPDISQREIAKALGISLGKANYCLKALIDVGFVKATNFRNSENKLAYAYLLTPSGIEQKAAITVRFLKQKIKEYQMLTEEIEELKREAVLVSPEDKSNGK